MSFELAEVVAKVQGGLVPCSHFLPDAAARRPCCAFRALLRPQMLGEIAPWEGWAACSASGLQITLTHAQNPAFT